MMPLREKLVLLLFLTAVAAVYVTAGGILFNRLLGRPASKNRAAVLGRWTVFALAGIGALCIGYAFLEPYRPEVTRLTVRGAHMPTGGRLRIALLSDLHCEAAARIEGELPDLVAAESPDVILYAGDALNAIEGLPLFRECMTRLARIAPVYAVRGNWDVVHWKKVDLYAGTGVTLLEKDAVKVSGRGAEAWIAGARLFNEWLPGEALAQAPRDAPRVLLYHMPGGVAAAAADGADLCVTGHIHGGQVRLPGYGALVTLSATGKKYEAGLYRVKETWLYVNRGIGMEGGPAPRVRFNCRPEITIIDLVGAE
jgi:predicted MPP superfamily phosphohydrolase